MAELGLDPKLWPFYNMHMTLRHGTEAEPVGADAKEELREGRRPYSPPRILSREPLESVAAVCAPSPPAKSNPGFCPQGPISS